MLAFYIKKNFFDGWDNFLTLTVFNLISYAIFIALYFAIAFFVENPVLFFIFLCIVIYIVILVFFSISMSMAEIAYNKSISIFSIFTNIRAIWKDALFLSILYFVLFIASTIALPFYYSMGDFFGFFMAGIIFWLFVMTLLALQWFMPLSVQYKGGFLKTLKKSFLLLLDNGGFSFFMALYSLFLFAFSALLAFFAPGFSGVLLAQNNALKLRMYKYDWLEENPDLQTKERKKIPWDTLIANDQEIIGQRTLKSIIFPWK